MDDDEKMSLAERQAAAGAMVAVLMEYLASLGIGSLEAAAKHLRRSAETLRPPIGTLKEFDQAARLMEQLAAHPLPPPESDAAPGR